MAVAQLKEWTVGELIATLSQFDNNLKVVLDDADTHWTITKFMVDLDTKHNEVQIYPSDYSDMVAR